MTDRITLTERERQVFAWLADELHNTDIGILRILANSIRRSLGPVATPTESASPPRAPAEPIDICERLDTDAKRNEALSYGRDPAQDTADLEREAAAEIRRLRDERAALESVLDQQQIAMPRTDGERRPLIDRVTIACWAANDKDDEKRGFRAGIEAAARWHDQQHKAWDEETDAVEQEREWSLTLHREAAAALRALADAPAPDPLLPGLSASVGDDGCWIYFKTRSGKSAAFHVANSLGNGRSIMGAAVREWCAEREGDRRAEIAKSEGG